MVDQFVAPGSRVWWALVCLAAFGRLMDLGSTWIATPNLELEGNPIARKLGWKGGIALNALLVPAFACWPLLAISLTTTSLLVAARNCQNAWLMRSLGESAYRQWFSRQVVASPRWLVRGAYLMESLLTAIVGVCLMVFSSWALVPFGIGLGMTGYAAAIAVFTALGLRKRRCQFIDQ